MADDTSGDETGRVNGERVERPFQRSAVEAHFQTHQTLGRVLQHGASEKRGQSTSEGPSGCKKLIFH